MGELLSGFWVAGDEKGGRERDRLIRLLAVDDDPDTLELIWAIIHLRGLPFEVRTAGDGSEAYSAVLSFRPEIVVLNYEMPQVDGIALCEQIVQESRIPRPKLILNSAIGPSEIWTKALEAGADRFLPVPFTPENLLAILQDLAGYED